MGLIITFGLSVFLFGGLYGFFYPHSKFWKWIDVIYYPLAAFGIGLIFINATGQRQLLDLTQVQAAQERKLQELSLQKPDAKVQISDQLFNSYLGLVSTIVTLDEACRYPGNTDARCSDVRRLAPSVKELLNLDALNSKLNFPERFAATCTAADKLILSLGDESVLSHLISQELVASYKEIARKKYSSYSIDAVASDITNFRNNVEAAIDRLTPILHSQSSKTGQLVEESYRNEADFAVTLIRGLHICVSYEREGVAALSNWAREHKAESRIASETNQAVRELSSNKFSFPLVAYLNLSIWPYVLILALAFKFAKGISGVSSRRRKESAS